MGIIVRDLFGHFVLSMISSSVCSICAKVYYGCSRCKGESKKEKYGRDNQHGCTDERSILNDVAFPIHPTFPVGLPAVHARPGGQYDNGKSKADPTRSMVDGL